ncbi:MAG TPA: arginase family protein [Solirubrobacterales bacterium]|nr:arginase family protein [Solirubrobacterales bacterium]
MEPFTFIGVPIDSVGRDGGAELGPLALRELGLPLALGGGDGGDLDLKIRGELRDPQTGILASDDVLAATTAIRAAVTEQVGGGARPFLAGGCCAELPGALAGARDALGPIGLVHLDGHADLYDGETSTTGEAADMPAAVALGLGPEAWVQAAGGASVGPQHLALIGYRDREESIEDGMRQPETLSPAPILRPLEVLREAGPSAAAVELGARLGSAVPIWLHFDVDVLDPEAFPATDYLMPDGASWEEIAEVLAPLLGSPALIGASIGCYNPEKDPGGACGKKLVEVLGAAAGGQDF